jgi:hypothetical protein
MIAVGGLADESAQQQKGQTVTCGAAAIARRRIGA